MVVDEAAATTSEENGVLIIEDQSMSTINISDEAMTAISDKINAIRTDITS